MSSRLPPTRRSRDESSHPAHRWYGPLRARGYAYQALSTPLMVVLGVVGLALRMLSDAAAWMLAQINAPNIIALRREVDACGAHVGRCDRCDAMKPALEWCEQAMNAEHVGRLHAADVEARNEALEWCLDECPCAVCAFDRRQTFEESENMARLASVERACECPRCAMARGQGRAFKIQRGLRRWEAILHVRLRMPRFRGRR